MKWKKMSQYDEFHREWTQRIYEVKDSKNILWKQVYLDDIPNKFVEYLKAQDIFKHPYELHTWGEIYYIITNAFVSLCTNMKVKKSIQNISRLPESKSICEKYGLCLEDPVKVRKRSKKILKKIWRNKYRGKYFVSKPYSKNKRHNQKGFYRRYPKTHYYSLEDIKLKSFKM